MGKKTLFKEAIAEAEDIRRAAAEIAKETLSESITPHIKSLLALKLQEMEEAEEEDVVAEAEEAEEPDEEEGQEADNDSEESEEEAEVEDVEGEEEIEVKDMEVEDLKALIRDIVHQEMGAETGEGEEDLEDLEDFEEPIGGVEVETGEEGGDDMVASDDEIDLNELLAELEAEEDLEEGKKEEKTTKEELDEALKTIRILRKQLNEVNVFNAKLLYLSKMLKTGNLSESQKVSIIQAFDKAETVKEAQLVYETLSEGITPRKATTGRLTEQKRRSFASAPAGGKSTKPAVITEVSEAMRRMQKLAGIIK